MKNIFLFICCFCSFVFAQAQQTPAPAQSKAMAVRGGTIHVGNGKVIQNGLIIFENGKLQTVTSLDNMPPVKWNDYQVVEAEGKQIYPGLIALNSQLGLIEIGAVGATRDNSEIGSITPNIRSIIAYNTDSKVIPTVRSNGVMLAQVVPQNGRIPGQSCIVQLDAWNWEDAAIKMEDGIFLNWPNAFRRSGWWAEPGTIKKNEKYVEQVAEIENLFKEAKAYSKNKSPESTNLKLEAMRGLFDGSKKLYIATSFAKTITEAVLVAKKMGITPVIVGGEDAWRITDFLKENNVPIVLGQTQALPYRRGEDIDQPFKNPAILQEAGILYALSMDGYWQNRNLPFQAGQAVGFGLDYEDAVSALTLNAAKILGIDELAGSVEKGKDATFIICDGDMLDMRTNKLSNAFIQGREISLDNKQEALYRKFSEKYKSGKK